MHNLKTFATALAMSGIFIVVFWAQVGLMAAAAAGAPAKPGPAGIESDPYQNIALIHGPILSEFASVAR